MSISRPARIEDAWRRWRVPRQVARGLRPQIVPYLGYGSKDFVRVLGRVVLQDPRADQDTEPVGALEEAQRGWRSFTATPVPFIPVTVRAGAAVQVTRTDRSGYIDVIVRRHRFEPGWQEVELSAPAANGVTARVNVVSHKVRVGIVADIDDTVMVTYLPRVMLAAWNSFVVHTTNRKPVPGMPELFAQLQRTHPDAPTFYVSTGAWNVAPTLQTFLRTHGYPEGPMLLTDWGPTNTGWFRSGMEHKRTALRRLALEFPKVEWYLIGDDGQHDPLIYQELAREHPSHVKAVLIRELNPVEQVLAHGTTSELRPPAWMRPTDAEAYVPYIEAPDGVALARQLRRVTSHIRTKN